MDVLSELHGRLHSLPHVVLIVNEVRDDEHSQNVDDPPLIIFYFEN